MALLFMPRMVTIEQLYKPLQPTIRGGENGVSYLEQSPDARLAPLIHCYWQLVSNQPLPQPFMYRVVADGCIDVFFDLSVPGDAFVMGLSTTYTEFFLPDSFNYVGIRFLPTGFPRLYRVDAAALTNRVDSFRDVLPVVAETLIDLLAGYTTLDAIRPCLDVYFVQLLLNATLTPDSRLGSAIAAILTRGGTLNVLTELDTALSHRQLSRLFQFYVGDTPKVFSRIVRFQQLLRGQASGQGKMLHDLGYYDQAHFIREFKTLYGQTPGSLAG